MFTSNARTAIFSLKMYQKRLAAGLRPDPLGELTALPQTPIAGLRGAASRQGLGRRGEGDGRKGEERDGGRERNGSGKVGPLQVSKQIDATEIYLSPIFSYFADCL